MSDLISRSEAINRMIEESDKSQKGVIHINTIKRILQDIDTAFDTEKVIEQLKEAETNISSLGHYAVYADDAIKIVLKGGVERNINFTENARAIEKWNKRVKTE